MMVLSQTQLLLILACVIHCATFTCQELELINEDPPQRITFYKLLSPRQLKFSSEKYGTGWRALDPAYFVDNKLPLNNRFFKPTGILYFKFQRYCDEHNIPYNRTELKKFRRRSVAATGLYVLACFGLLPVMFDAIYNNRGNPILFTSPNASILWTLPIFEAMASGAIKSNAEKKLRERLFKLK